MLEKVWMILASAIVGLHAHDFSGFLAKMPDTAESAEEAEQVKAASKLQESPVPDAQALQKRVFQKERQKLRALEQARAMLIKSGWFLGTEMAISGADFRQDFSREDGQTDTLVSYQGRVKGANFNMGVVGGYQHYFGNTQKHGVKVSTHLYGGTPSVVRTSIRDISLATTYTPLSFGLDVKYIFDFFTHMGKHRHTLGLSAGLGWRMYEYFASIATLRTRISTFQLTEPKNIFNQGFYPTIGLHYYLNHHQFSLDYRFGGVIGYVSSMDSVIRFKSGKFKGDEAFSSFKTTLVGSSFMAFNYAYLF
ncbi:hypothetical protein ACFOPX_06125 [Helicobacter baculiformis]|uniref:Outer membrane protein n=1 Tax=Helicobacter baculiformis TaxID=427351 RepID=A0ABV7ZJZ5_9HELI|nr:hypothetical protein [Helicobacter baculiformis]